MTAEDGVWMSVALRLAWRGLGRTAENPSVGCVLVRDGRILSRAHTADGGRPHAEALALERAGPAARGATAYVTLEPCAHWGRTPPCANALVAAGVARVVVALGDPDPRVNGKGIDILEAAGVAVTVGVGADAARALLSGYFARRQRGTPLVTLKLATSLDGKIALADGRSQWITGAVARDQGHLLRARHDAILVGSGTVRQDDPSLTCRLPGLGGRSPARVVLDTGLALSPSSTVVRTAGETPTWVIAREGAPAENVGRLSDAGVTVIEVPTAADGRPALAAALAALAERGVGSVLVEGGATIARALLAADLVDRIAVFRAPAILGGDSLDAVAPLGLTDLASAPRFRSAAVEAVGDDTMEILVRR